jgi:hypothetical protein
MNTFNYFSSKIDQIWNTNFNSLRANVGVIDVERQGGGLDGGSTFKSAGNAQQRNSILLALKTAINLETFLEKRMYNTAVLDGIMQKHSTRIVRK